MRQATRAVIRKANEGKLKISPAKARKPKEVKENDATSSQPTDSQASESDSDSGGQSGKSETGGSQASAKPGPHPCTRCGKIGHEFSSCYSSTHFSGSWLTSPKPCPVPEDFWAVDQTWEARNGANKTKVNTMHAHMVTPDQLVHGQRNRICRRSLLAHSPDQLMSCALAQTQTMTPRTRSVSPWSLILWSSRLKGPKFVSDSHRRDHMSCPCPKKASTPWHSHQAQSFHR